MAIKPVYQLNTPNCTPENPGTCGGADCAICSIIVALDFASSGKIRPTQKQVRSRIGVPSSGGLTLNQVGAGIRGFEERFKNYGFQGAPKFTVHDNDSYEEFTQKMEHDWRQTIAIVFWDNGTWNEWCKNKKPRLSGDLEFRGTHAIVVRDIRRNDKTGMTVKIFNSLWDGRLDMPSKTRVIKGAQRVPVFPFRNAVFARAANGKIDWVEVKKARRVINPPEPPIDPCADATEPSGKLGHSSVGAE
jgi:hypothetical protein